MKIRLLAVGNKMPAWVEQGYQEYARRLPRDCSLELVEISPGHRGKNASTDKAMQQEADALKKAIRPGEHVVALAVEGKPWSTERLSEELEGWRSQGGDVALLVGGPDGMTDEVLRLAKQRWSLSPLTLPHPLVRVLLSEQIYRAWTILQGHPYHK
ncbi:MAG: 23S rRNA (pseudouridine(1915)-N(3))-methyltransferase RlmH [Thalassolituus sp.]|jgi:23S rRNA (pseudouridine1915-N3)-methyltransferase|uniref:23S rRNA (pseudouridine(1915)-N(3))-methyltransferase RlmH n=1 Tax=unclassified Thalassolituus TaxID=2624967 RepID=UPI000B665A1B|nr:MULTISPECIES: 23S rRNA (pseudouridine(1915)-N(3))-methyltransferase RlmH [unclassified Thalassolituus]MBN56880.1 23S rRNA (pseudouridine(1915)-N(3))-methyltransferase RlmH [Oceanospirillaceae bacterium]MDQ4424167.1 23S rRNA (pseudouridine(1915)-N(3))-methyltransferase RlmH [Thalassolituus sp.]MDQ4426418.1 23S rRNA (pseudouridine(1915)-N(3))-methyltransferase RlmH [Thalassolituus sp.]OUX67006.1 MAG: 23S rRNA (pseudouridine(1915)-N(3))-methyltransferase RlmH [Oceanospirillaceae bacterium TMED2|tara:strand:+ start:222 stop:689 length:468 start_codon:yes stop_codon:yes gene_type:complete